MAKIIDLTNGPLPANTAHFVALMRFCNDVLAVCRRLGVEPVLNGSLAVFAYTKHPSLGVNDIDFACAEADFERLAHAFATAGIETRLKPWHVLQARRNGLKVEFDAVEYWQRDLSGECEMLTVGDLTFKLICLRDLQELYRRGLQTENMDKRRAIAAKVVLLSRVA